MKPSETQFDKFVKSYRKNFLEDSPVIPSETKGKYNEYNDPSYKSDYDIFVETQGNHTEKIKCPECGKVQEATVEHTVPWNSYVHECECGYVIMESDWEPIGETQGDWEKRFDEEFPSPDGRDFLYTERISSLKRFIREEISQALQQERAKFIRQLNGLTVYPSERLTEPTRVIFADDRDDLLAHLKVTNELRSKE